MLSKLKSSTLETSSWMLYDLLLDVKVQKVNKSIETNTCFWDLCTTNDLSSSWYNLVWFAPYDESLRFKNVCRLKWYKWVSIKYNMKYMCACL